MLPGLRFFLSLVVLSVGVLVFGLGATSLLRATHDEVSPARLRLPRDQAYRREQEARVTTLALLRVEAAASQTATSQTAEPQTAAEIATLPDIPPADLATASVMMAQQAPAEHARDANVSENIRVDPAADSLTVETPPSTPPPSPADAVAIAAPSELESATAPTPIVVAASPEPAAPTRPASPERSVAPPASEAPLAETLFTSPPVQIAALPDLNAVASETVKPAVSVATKPARNLAAIKQARARLMAQRRKAAQRARIARAARTAAQTPATQNPFGLPN